MMKKILKSRVAYYVGFSLMYIVFSKLVGFEYAVLLGIGTIIGEQSRNQNKDDDKSINTLLKTSEENDKTKHMNFKEKQDTVLCEL